MTSATTPPVTEAPATEALIKDAAEAGIASFNKTAGHFPDRFALLHKYAPGTFAGYGLIRSALMQDPPAGQLDLLTKELVFTGLSSLYGDKYGAVSHAIAALKLGATPEQIGEVMTQVIMVGGITAWNLVGYDVMRACEAHAAGQPLPG
ncbi:MAG: carboxymuconolactone decarboxylase family protein [Janthinobacterium lividum]